MNHIKQIYVINLDHRKDRLEGFMNNMIGLALEHLVERIPAVYVPEFGVLGCIKSVILVLEKILNSEHNHAILCEDDVRFRDNLQTKQFLTWLDSHIDEIDYNIISLSGNHTVRDFKIEDSEYPQLKRVKCMQAPSCFIIRKSFAKTFLDVMIECRDKLELTKNRHLYSPDQYIKKYQSEWKWFLSYPILAYQAESYSDLEGRVVNYGC